MVRTHWSPTFTTDLVCDRFLALSSFCCSVGAATLDAPQPICAAGGGAGAAAESFKRLVLWCGCAAGAAAESFTKHWRRFNGPFHYRYSCRYYPPGVQGTEFLPLFFIKKIDSRPPCVALSGYPETIIWYLSNPDQGLHSPQLFWGGHRVFS